MALEGERAQPGPHDFTGRGGGIPACYARSLSSLRSDLNGPLDRLHLTVLIPPKQTVKHTGRGGGIRTRKGFLPTDFKSVV